ncbi:uncharacterized protein METZ01_LOCUS358518, partial [marine metagenome]
MKVYTVFDLRSLCLAALVGFWSAGSLGQSLTGITDRECTYGNCIDGRGTLKLSSQWGKGEYMGNFKDGEFHGYGRLEVPISFIEEEVYAGNWVKGLREGRGTHWNGKGKLYIGERGNNKRHGQGSYFFNLPEWR